MMPKSKERSNFVKDLENMLLKLIDGASTIWKFNSALSIEFTGSIALK
jgi:hypothetical protein